MVRAGAAEGVDRLGVAQEAALAVLAGDEPGAGAVDHLGIDDGEFGLLHVVEFHQAVGGEGLVAGGAAAEPFIALVLALKADESLIALDEEFLAWAMSLGSTPWWVRK